MNMANIIAKAIFIMVDVLNENTLKQLKAFKIYIITQCENIINRVFCDTTCTKLFVLFINLDIL